MPTGTDIIWTSNQIENIKLDFLNRESIYSMSLKYNINESSIERLIKKLNLNRTNLHKRILSNEQLNDIKHRYLNTSELFKDIAKSHNISMTTLLKILIENNIPTRKHKKPKRVNESYFEIINTPNKAYFLGLLAADGYINDKGNGQLRLGISLQERDGYILELFNKDIQHEGNVRFIKKRNEGWQGSYSLDIISDKICKDLINLGVTPRKSFTYEFPNNNQVPEHLMFHFIRGYFDGDGCITCSKNYNNISYRFFIVGTKKTCEGMANILFGKYRLGSGRICKRIPKDHRKPIYTYYVSGNNNIKKLYKLIYEDAEMFLTRKKCKFEGVFNQ